ncbi:unnamed protein product [Toxocara canis]|uniref:UV-stimulated scaffold protein A C-terminal domain-containing protein n=1 Tax=Toxocara canis TaxID=6265 RepID=A0A3P7GDZ4_TOXCA|nr:unnamed protein product [Toxocara canis]
MIFKALRVYLDVGSIAVVLPTSAPVITKDEGNEAIISSLLDSVKLLRFYEKRLSKWIKKLTKFGGRSTEKAFKEIVELNSRVALEIERCDELKLKECKKQASGSESDSDEFEDVPEKEGLELEFKVPDEVPSHILVRLNEMDEANQPCTSGKIVKSSQPAGALPEGGNEGRVSQIPTLSFGLDLKYWGEKNVQPAEIPRNNSDCHRFWRPSDESNTTCSDDTEVYNTRVMTFVGKEERVTRRCRAPLRDGSLCPRMDKHKCPVHGVIIDRDEMGFPSQEVPAHSSNCAESKEEQEYMRDLEAATGIDLRFDNNRKRKKGFKKREIPPSHQKKLLDRRTVKRVSATLDAIRKARAAKNFEHQFNYALSRT